MAAPAWAPTPARVAAILRAYTRGERGSDGRLSIAAEVTGELDAFTDRTRPTLAQVTELIEQACGDVIGAYGGRQPCRPAFQKSSTSAATYRAAQLVCVSYFPETTRGEGNAFDALQKLYDGVIGSIADEVKDRCPLDPDDPDDDGAGLAPSGRGRDSRYPVMGFRQEW